ncbi:MAG: MATE family efflux transporter [Lachnospiraceae bacterium]
MYSRASLLLQRNQLGLAVVVSAGVTNMVLDYLFIVVLGFGLKGAAMATVTGELIGGLTPILYFSRKNSSLLRLGRTKFDGRLLLNTCANGSSELMTNLSSSIVNTVFNLQLMKFSGENGVAAFGTIMYASFIFSAVFFGYSIGSAPVISYNLGAENYKELKNVYGKSMRFVGIWGVFLVFLTHMIAEPLARIFVGYDTELLTLTSHGFKMYATAFLISGFNIFGSAFFTALNNGVLSALISFLRTLVFQLGSVLILPVLLGIDGIWYSVTLAEVLTLCVTLTFMIAQRKKYYYI